MRFVHGARVIHRTVQDQPVQIVTIDTTMYQEHEKFYDLFEVLWLKFLTVVESVVCIFITVVCKMIYTDQRCQAAYAISL